MAQQKVPAPQCDTSAKSDAWHYVDDAGGTLAADLDLTAITTCPKWAPQKSTFWVDSALAVIVVVDEDGKSVPLSVSAGVPLVFTRPIKTITDAGTGNVNALFEWFDPNGSTDWNK